MTPERRKDVSGVLPAANSDQEGLVGRMRDHAAFTFYEDPGDQAISLLAEAADYIERLEFLVKAYRERDDAEVEAVSLRMHDVGTKRWDSAMDVVVDAEKALGG